MGHRRVPAVPAWAAWAVLGTTLPTSASLRAMTTCICGNTLDEKSKVRVRVSPCRCEQPGAGSRVAATPGSLPTFMHDDAVQQRRKVGLPDCTDYERGVAARWT